MDLKAHLLLGSLVAHSLKQRGTTTVRHLEYMDVKGSMALDKSLVSLNRYRLLVAYLEDRLCMFADDPITPPLNPAF